MLRALKTIWVVLAVLVASITTAQTVPVRVTAADVTNAILASTTGSATLRQYATAIGQLAMFESGGNLSVYNGSCCYGVLQMNTSNIRRALGISPEVYRQLPLQAQVNAWASIMTPAMLTYPIRALTAMGTFDGRAVDGALLLSCVQLGTGNCQRMINSRSCAGFADRNGTTICNMADHITGVTGGSGSGGGSGGSTYVPTPAPLPGHAMANCISDGFGGCYQPSQSMEDAFQAGSGYPTASLRSLIQALTFAVTLLVMGSALLGYWRGYSAGKYSYAELIIGVKKVFMIVLIVAVVMTMV